jgi:TIR domain
MSRIFVSHASADGPFVESFVDTVLRLGCGASHEEVFFTSGADTGVPAGADLNTFVRDQIAGEETLVVAMVTPAFLSRPYCLAELGAAWSRAETLFPLTLPGMGHELGGVLGGLLVKTLDDPAALDQLSDRVARLLQRRPPAATWSKYRHQWLGEVGDRVKQITVPGANEPVSIASCSREPGHMEVFWTDASSRVFYRWWRGEEGWSRVEQMQDVEADYLAAVGGDGLELLFGVKGSGEVWVKRWTEALVAGEPRLIAGPVRGPLSALARGSEVELFAWTADGRQCHLWLEGDGWTSWTTDW